MTATPELLPRVAVTVSPDALRWAAESLTSTVLDGGSDDYAATAAAAAGALELLDALKAAGVGCAAELCRLDLQCALVSALDALEG